MMTPTSTWQIRSQGWGSGSTERIQITIAAIRITISNVNRRGIMES